MTLSRRNVLRGAVALGAAGAVAPLTVRNAEAAVSATPLAAGAGTVFDCVIVGAGLSGLAAARRLTAAGRNVVVVEARNRPGGRVVNVDTLSGNLHFDGGAEFVGPTQNHIQALADEFGVGTFPTYNEGNNLYYRDGAIKPYPAAIGIPIDQSVGEVVAGIAKLTAIVLTIKPDRPWDHLLASYWDSITFQDWINRTVVSPDAKLLFSLICSSTLSVGPDEISALFMFNYIAAAGDEKNPGTMFRLLNTDGGAQERFFDGGAYRVPEAMANTLAGRIVYDAPVSKIDTRSGKAVVITSAGTFTGKRVIVAMSPAIAGRISYPGGLSVARNRLHAGMKMGYEGKFQAAYDEPFWRDAGLSGQVVGNGSPLDVTFETYSQGKYWLMGFISGDHMRDLDDDSEASLIERCTQSFVDYFGPQARTGIVDKGYKRWDADPYSWGGPTGLPAPGLLTRAGTALRRPVGLIHWGGTEAAVYWQGYMDGAVTSGYRAADEVDTALG
jgi:monoamine oxidase